MPSPFYSFNIDNFQITQTRSAHTDTIYVSVTVQLGSEQLTAATPKSLGNLNNGTYSTGVSCPNVIIDGLPVVFNYLIVNAGSSAASAVTAAMESFGKTLASSGLNLPPFASSLQVVANNYPTALSTIFKPGSCDGIVAVEQNTFTLEELQSYTSRSPYFKQATSHTGTKAGSSCNSKLSAYLVNWSMANTADVPAVGGLPLGTVTKLDTAAYVLSQAGFGYQTVGKGGWVEGQSLLSPPQYSITEPVVLTLTTIAP